MKAAVVTKYGGPDVFEIQDLPVPEPGPGEVTIDVSHAGLNFAEVMGRTGLIPALKPPFVPGLEVSGTIRKVGAGVTDLTSGDPVIALTISGGYAEVVKAKHIAVYKFAELLGPLTFSEAATVPTAVPTAVGICELGRVHDGDVVVIEAAAGGLGSVAVQIAHHFGAKTVIGIVGSEDKRATATGHGYDSVVLRRDVTTEVPALTGGRGADVILDSVGGSRRRDLVNTLAPGGRLVAFGNASGAPEADIASSHLRANNRSVLGFSISALQNTSPEGTRALTLRSLELIRSSTVKLFGPREFTLDDVATAHGILGGGRSVGKMTLRIN